MLESWADVIKIDTFKHLVMKKMKQLFKNLFEIKRKYFKNSKEFNITCNFKKQFQKDFI